MKRIVIALLFCAALLQGGEALFFSTPLTCTKEAFGEEIKCRRLEMSWQWGDGCHFRFFSAQEEVYFEVGVHELKEREWMPQCVESRGEEIYPYSFSYQLFSDQREVVNSHAPIRRGGDGIERRCFADANPKVMSEEALAGLIKKQRVLFYTGAGISLASSVPAMEQLNALLGLDRKAPFEGAIRNPAAIAAKITSFRNACLYSVPSLAHYALKEIVFFKQTLLITENLDCLHEVSGITPYRVEAATLHEQIASELLEPFDYLICIGLSHDHRGLLSWYKKSCPRGRIVALDLSKPSYLGDEDFWLSCDLQVALPHLLQLIKP